jgi:phosphoribosyl-AMP cyclohydrolase
MKNSYFESIELLKDFQILALQGLIGQLNFNEKGLIAVITQDATSKKILMLAWMTVESIDKTSSTGCMIYWSRSREKLWIKGQTIDHIKALESIQIVYDGDALLCLVNQTGMACHMRRAHDFYFNVDRSNRTAYVLGSPMSTPV